MKKELKQLRKHLLKSYEWEMFMNKSSVKKSKAEYHLGRATSFSESALLIGEILKSKK